MSDKQESDILRSSQEMAEALHEVGAMDDETARKMAELCRSGDRDNAVKPVCQTCEGAGMVFRNEGHRLARCPDCGLSDKPDLPEDTVCIAVGHPDMQGRAWCGRYLTIAFAFPSVGDAALDALKGTRMIACPDCLSAIRCAFEANGCSFDPDPITQENTDEST